MGILRFILALAVVATHTQKLFPFPILPGYMAVQGFYIISGFYMALILTEKYLDKQHSYKLFITSRILRIYPLYFLMLVLTFMFYAVTLTPNNHNPLSVSIEFLKHNPWWMGLFLSFSNLFILGQDVFYFITDRAMYRMGDILLMPQAWTLSLEFMFYFLAPFLIRLKTMYLLILFVSSCFLRLLLLKGGLTHDPWIYRFFPTELALFLIGIFSFKLFQQIQYKKIPWLWNAAFFLAILMMTIFLQTIKFSPVSKALAYYAVLGLGMPFIFYLTKNNKFDRWVGEFSYPIYISHFLIRMIVCFYGISGKTDPKFGWWVVAGSFLLSYLMLYLVIYPIDKIREHRILNHKL